MAASRREQAWIGAIVDALDDGPPMQGLERAAKLLRRALGATVVELRLRARPSSDAVPSAVTVFRVPAKAAPLSDDHAPSARGVARQPLGGSNTAIGEVVVAWTGEQPSPARPPRLLGVAARMISAALRSRLEELEAELQRAMAEEQSARDETRVLLKSVAAATGAASVTWIAADDVVAEGGVAAACRGGAAAAQCPAVETGTVQQLCGPRRDWPAACRRMAVGVRSPCCIPLPSPGARLVLDYGDAVPATTGRDLPVVEALTGTASSVRSARVAAQPRGGLEARCLGEFEVAVDGVPMADSAFRRRKARSLLQMLVLARGTPLPRSTLVERLWPEVEGAPGANRLHGVVHALRQGLAGTESGVREFIDGSADGYALRVDAPIWTDLQAAAERAAAANGAVRAGQLRAAVDHWQRALELYRGDLFAGEEGDWLAAERVNQRRRALEIVALLSDAALRLGEPECAITTLRRGVAIDPLREDLHQSLIQALADQGRRAEALDQYQACCDALQCALGISPMAATRRIAGLLDVPGA